MILITNKMYEERVEKVEGLTLKEVEECIVYNYECITELVFDDIDDNDEDEMLSDDVQNDIVWLKKDRRKLFERKEELIEGK